MLGIWSRVSTDNESNVVCEAMSRKETDNWEVYGKRAEWSSDSLIHRLLHVRYQRDQNVFEIRLQHILHYNRSDDELDQSEDNWQDKAE